MPGLEIEPLALPEVLRLRPPRHGDHRGYFSETWNRRTMAAAGLDLDFVQDNQSMSRQAGTVRGLHFQTPPHAQAKLVRVLAGRIFDVAVDIRRSSPTFGRHVAVELDAEGGAQLYVPAGFAHGFMTLVPDTTVFYKVTEFYDPTSDRGILWCDPALGIAWPRPPAEAVLSKKDLELPTLSQCNDLFD